MGTVEVSVCTPVGSLNGGSLCPVSYTHLVQSGADLREGRDAFHEEDRRRDRPVIGRDQVRDRTL